VTGEGGSGKTSLNRQFALEAQSAHQALLIATGNCNAQTGIGDPYLPFREMLALLAGHVDDKRLLLDILEMRYMDRMAIGEREACEFIDEHARLADEIKDPFCLYTTASIRVCPAFLAGRFAGRRYGAGAVPRLCRSDFSSRPSGASPDSSQNMRPRSIPSLTYPAFTPSDCASS
jgi:hypothetical protein